MDPDSDTRSKTLKRLRQGSLDDEPDRPPPARPDGTGRANIQIELPSPGHDLAAFIPFRSDVRHVQGAVADQYNVSPAMLDGSPVAINHPVYSQSAPTSRVPSQLPGFGPSNLSRKPGKTYISGGTHIENHGTLNLNLINIQNHRPTAQPSTRLRSLLQNLNPSQLADYRYHADGQEGHLLRRTTCTLGTRVRTLEAVGSWAKDTSTSTESLYWLFGSAGSGKSTIAYTIATETGKSASTTLGANFFCSRHFDATRYSKHIVPTLAHHLARQCPSFAEALIECDFEVVHQRPRAQLEEFLARPWLRSAEARASDPNSPASYLVIIDALDEIQGDSGTELLRNLLDMINDGQLPGLKFFVTSRPNPAIVRHVESFANKKIYRLEEIPINEAEADIETYLNTALPHFKGSDLISKLVQLAAGLFIFAVTVVKHLTIRYPGRWEQRVALKKLLSMSAVTSTSGSPTQTLDQLYIQVLAEAFADLDEEVFASRLRITHAFLCAAEPTSAAVISQLLPNGDRSGDGDSDLEDDATLEFELRAVVDDVVQRLYSVLYVENGRVFSYHKSFPDFIFDRARSERFWCNQLTLHRLLTTSSLQLLSGTLHFNIAEIPSSYVFDKDNEVLQDEVQLTNHIPPHLRYACRHWAHHLERSGQHDNDHPLAAALANFIHLPALFWIEAMNILGWVALCDGMLQTASNSVPPDNDPLKQAFGEAASFALYFTSSRASQSTPHLYISALATWNRPAYPVAEWKTHFPDIPNFTRSRLDSAVIMKIDTDTRVTSVAISSDGELVAGGLWDPSVVRIWDTRVGNLIKTFEGHIDPVTSILFFKHNTRLVSTSRDATIRVWEVETARELRMMRAYFSPVRCACISPDESRIASGSDDGSIGIWEVETGNLIRMLEGHRSGVRSVSYSDLPTAWVCSGSDDGTVRIWDMESGQVLPGGVLGGDGRDGAVVPFVAFSPRDGSVISVLKEGDVRSWDRATFESRRLFDSGLGDVSKASLSRDGSKILLNSKTGRLQIWDTSSGQLVAVLNHSKGGNWEDSESDARMFPVNEKRVVVTGSRGIAVLDLSNTNRTSHPQGYVPSSTGLRGELGLAVSHDGAKILLASHDSRLLTWDGKTGKILLATRWTPRLFRTVGLGFSKDDRAIVCVSSLYAANHRGNVHFFDVSTVQLLDLSTGHFLEETRLPHLLVASDLNIARDGSMLIYKQHGKGVPDVVHVWDVSKRELVQTLETVPGGSSVDAIALSQRGEYAAAGALLPPGHPKPLTIHVWETLSGKLLWALEMTDTARWPAFNFLEFSGDCSRLAAALGPYVRLWDLATGDCIREWVFGVGNSDAVRSVAFSPDGSLLACGLRDDTVRLWDVESGKCVGPVLEGHSKVVFSPDGGKVISSSSEGEVRVWDITKAAPYRIQRSSDDPYSRPTGWLFDRDSDNLLIYLPPDDMVPDPSNTLVISRSSADSSLSFSYDTLGPRWQSCYSHRSSTLKPR